jgi:hypothetical protein
MAYILDTEKVVKNFSKECKNALFRLQGNDILVKKSRIESVSFSKKTDLSYDVSGLMKVSILKGEDEYEDLYRYTTELTVTIEDEIEKCGTIILNRLN